MDRAVLMVVWVISEESEYQSEFIRLLRPEEKEWLNDEIHLRTKIDEMW